MYHLKLKLTFKAARGPKLCTNGGGLRTLKKKNTCWIDLQSYTVILEGLQQSIYVKIEKPKKLFFYK